MLHIKEYEENLIFNCMLEEFNIEDVNNVLTHIMLRPEKSFIVNLSGVSKIKNTTLKFLKKITKTNKISLCNLEAEVFAAINLLNYDKSFNIYPNEESSIIKTLEFKNRKFKVV